MVFLFSLVVVPALPLRIALAQESKATPEQIQQKAASMGYHVTTQQIQEYEKGQQTTTVPTTAPPQTPQTSTPPAPAPGSQFLVAEFSGRANASNLQAFGYNVFTYSPTTFQPGLNVPTPVDYVVGPGDEIIISLWGETQLVQNLVVSKNGDIYIPNVGLVSVNGLTMKELKSKIFERLSKVYASLLPGKRGEASTFLNISTGQLRSVKIYVLGEVAKPGGYTLPALSSAFTALYYSGGPTINGSLRDVEVVRDGSVVDHIDLYNYLISGDQSGDVRLNEGDIVFVPPVGKRVAIAGSVFRPAIFELKKGESLKDVLQFASGLTFSAYYQTVHVERVIPFGQRKLYANNILDLDLNFPSADALRKSDFALDDGDVITIGAINNLAQNKLTIVGDVKHPGVYELSSGMRVRDLISKADSLFADAFMDQATLIRTLPSGRQKVIDFDLTKAMDGDSVDNLRLENLDEVRIYKLSDFFPIRSVSITGEVRKPGTYPRLNNMTLTDLINEAGGLTDLATTQDIEITGMDTVNSDILATKSVVSLPADYWNVKPSDNFMLKDYDRVLVKADSAKSYLQTVTVSGEVAFPGSYTILYRGEKLADFIKRAGGFKKSAYTKGMFVVRGNPELALLKAIPMPDTMLIRLYRGAPIVDRSAFNAQFGGRIPVIWKDIEDDSTSQYNLQLMPGDVIIVPPNPHTITVAGDVGLPSTVPYKEGAGLDYYIGQAGGYTPTSASGDAMVILPNGMKWKHSGWFFIPDPKIPSGSTIYVPSEIQTTAADVWPLIRDIITVVSSTAVLVLTISKL